MIEIEAGLMMLPQNGGKPRMISVLGRTIDLENATEDDRAAIRLFFRGAASEEKPLDEIK